MFRIAGYSDTVGLWRHSRTLASSVRNHIVLDVLIALEKCGLLAELGTQHGVTPAALAGFDPVQLEAALEYLTEAEILEQLGRGRFRVRKLREFPRLRSAVYAAMALFDVHARPVTSRSPSAADGIEFPIRDRGGIP